MPHAQRVDEIRRHVAETFAQMDVREPQQFRESLLIRKGSYCGRRFEADGAYAVWFLEENEVKFYSTRHSPARIVRLPAETARIAA
jgi:hypothetical protein